MTTMQDFHEILKIIRLFSISLEYLRSNFTDFEGNNMCLLGVSYSIIMVRFLCFYWEISIEIIFSPSFTEFYSKVGRARIGDLGKICSSQDAQNLICKNIQR